MLMLARLVDTLFQVVYLLLLARVILSWVPHTNSHPIVNRIYEWTDPILRPFQNIIPSWKIAIDLSPMLAFFALSLLKRVIFSLFF